jgi:uncharacterized membrane protein HdeD (DUF308 family)
MASSWMIISDTGTSPAAGVLPGIAALLLGGLLLFFPGPSLRILIYLAGALALLLGVILLVLAWRIARTGTPAFAVPVIFGIFSIVFGLVSWANPGIIGAFMAVIFGFTCILVGLGAAFVGLLHASSPVRRMLVATGGILVAIIGILTLFYPQLSVTVILQLLGLLLMGAGAVLLAEVLTILWRGRSRENRWQEKPGPGERELPPRY